MPLFFPNPNLLYHWHINGLGSCITDNGLAQCRCVYGSGCVCAIRPIDYVPYAVPTPSFVPCVRWCVFFPQEGVGAVIQLVSAGVNLLIQPLAFRILHASVWKGKKGVCFHAADSMSFYKQNLQLRPKRPHTFKTDKSFLMDLITVVSKWELYCCIFWLIRPQWRVRYKRHMCISHYTQKIYSHYTPGHTFNMRSTKIPQVWTTSITMHPPYQMTSMSFHRRAMLNHLPLCSQL